MELGHAALCPANSECSTTNDRAVAVGVKVTSMRLAWFGSELNSPSMAHESHVPGRIPHEHLAPVALVAVVSSRTSGRPRTAR